LGRSWSDDLHHRFASGDRVGRGCGSRP
jgi:hypothetical protein